MKPTTIFYYCKLSTAIEKILPKKEIRLSPLLNTNDPRENQDLIFCLTQNAETKNELKYDEFIKKVNGNLRNECKVICFSLNSGNYTAGNSYSTMWAHYGDNHTGICLELDYKKFIEENKKYIVKKYFRKIKYFDFEKDKNEHPRIDICDINTKKIENHIRKVCLTTHLKHVFFTKNKEWNYENELRLIYFSKKQKEEFCKIKKSLVKIHLGIKFNDIYLPAISKLINSNTLINKMVYKDVKLCSREIKI